MTDYPVAVTVKDDPGFRRTLSFQAAAPPGNLFMRAAVGEDIKPTPGGGFVVDGRLVLRLAVPHVSVWSSKGGPEVPYQMSAENGAIVRHSQGRMELLVPIAFFGKEASVEEDYVW